MATSEERLKVLQMIRDNKISAAEGLKLLEALSAGQKAPARPAAPPPPPPPPVSGAGARWFRVRVTDTNTGRVRVNVRLPISVVTTGFKLGAHFSPEIDGLDTKTLLDAIRSGAAGQVMDLQDTQDGERVEVFLE